MNCPVCTAEITDLYPKPRCRRCGYVESCCQPEWPCRAAEENAAGEAATDD